MILCDNCLDPVEDNNFSKFPLGPSRGTQRDPYEAKVRLCVPCQDTLGGHLGGDELPVDLHAFHARYAETHTVDR